MEKKKIVVCAVVGFLGLLSAATGFAAEAKRIKGSQVQLSSPDECIYPRSPALGLGLTAAASLMIAKIIINVASGCVCCRRGPHQSNSNWTLTLICFVVSWFTFVVAFLLLLTGAALNEQHGQEENAYFNNYYCYVVKPGVFAAASVLALVSVGLGIIYYLTLASEKNMNNDGPWNNSNVVPQQPQFPPPPHGGGIAMGQPQFPPPPPPPSPPQGPVFVHEDTYMRRQLATA